MKQSHKTILLWLLLILMFVSIYNLFSAPGRGDEPIDFSTFIADVEKQPESIEKVGVIPVIFNVCPKTDFLIGNPFFNNPGQIAKGAAHNKQYIAGVDSTFLSFAGFTKTFDLLNHRNRIVWYF